MKYFLQKRLVNREKVRMEDRLKTHKENDVWEKDKELIKILTGIKKTALNNRMKLDKWQDANDGWMVRENIQMKYIALVSNVMTIIEDEDKEINKIINAIGKKVYLDEDTKKEYI